MNERTRTVPACAHGIPEQSGYGGGEREDPERLQAGSQADHRARTTQERQHIMRVERSEDRVDQKRVRRTCCWFRPAGTTSRIIP